MEKRYDVWVEITANKEWILDAVKFEETMKKCRAVGMTGIILSVKDTTGFSLYPSQIAPHYSKYDKTFLPAYDYVKQCFSIIKNLGMKCYAAFDTFAAGNGKNPHPDMPGIKKDGFLGILTGGTIATAGGIAAAIFFGYVMAVIFTPKAKP